MFVQNDDLSIYVTRGDECDITFTHAFKKGDVVRFKVTKKKDCGTVMLQRDFNVTASGDMFTIHLEGDETKLGEVISKPTDFWYEVELNPDTDPNTIIGYDEDGAKILRLYPEGKDVDGDDIEVVGSKTLQELVDYALEEARNSGEFKGDPGYTPVRGKDYWTEDDKNEIKRELEETTLGDIESALDSIIAIQEELINNGSSKEYYCQDCGERMSNPYFCDNCGTPHTICGNCGNHYVSWAEEPCPECGEGSGGWYETCPDCGEEFYTEGGPHDGCSGGGSDGNSCPNCGETLDENGWCPNSCQDMEDTFYIYDTPYTYHIGMTWEEFVNSGYNQKGITCEECGSENDKFSISDESIYFFTGSCCGIGHVPLVYDEESWQSVYSNEAIESGHNYVW